MFLTSKDLMFTWTHLWTWSHEQALGEGKTWL